ncbi:hypothetical protein DKX38_016491 [Salix brachista]|uniref:Uncharacterized protein n=1 Tax=Salix brachista TaxID=2182728 RepID=A0A5N5L8U0_9ROSI|nr:hypothetical protein DKX38_016491 [Salix brachista]
MEPLNEIPTYSNAGLLSQQLLEIRQTNGSAFVFKYDIPDGDRWMHVSRKGVVPNCSIHAPTIYRKTETLNLLVQNLPNTHLLQSYFNSPPITAYKDGSTSTARSTSIASRHASWTLQTTIVMGLVSVLLWSIYKLLSRSVST